MVGNNRLGKTRLDVTWAGEDGVPETSVSLLERLRNRSDRGAWNHFCVLYRPVIELFIRSQALVGPDAEEITGEVLFHLWKNLPPRYQLTSQVLTRLERDGVPASVLLRLKKIKKGWFTSADAFVEVLGQLLLPEEMSAYGSRIQARARLAGFVLEPRRGKFRAWLWRVVRNAVNDWRRRQGRWKRARSLPEGEDFPSGASSRLHLHDENEGIVELALAQVRLQTSEATWLCFQEFFLRQRPRREVARELGISPHAVSVASLRVLRRVRYRALLLKAAGTRRSH
jgi:RNA polymerase sigma factor (sigma-70 family)